MTDGVLADDGCRLWTMRTGRGDPLILCHGGPGLWDTFDDLVPMLDPLATTIRWDQRGCGRSDRRGPYSVARSVTDLDAVRDGMAGPRTALFGHSWGAHLVLEYALAYPDRVSHLIYVSGTGIDRDRGWHPYYERNLRRALGEHLPRWEALRTRERTEDEDRELAVLQWTADYADPGSALAHARRVATPWYGINHDCNAAMGAELERKLAGTDLVARCRESPVPVLIIDGTEDIRPRWAVDSLYEALPDARRVSLAGAGHSPWVEQPDAFRDAVASFLGAGR